MAGPVYDDMPTALPNRRTEYAAAAIGTVTPSISRMLALANPSTFETLPIARALILEISGNFDPVLRG
jgi:hypothetical protein